MGSELKVESIEGEGSRFYFEVEFKRCEPEETVASRVDGRALIYIVEHDGDIYRDVLNQLRDFGLKPIEIEFQKLLNRGVAENSLIVTFNHKQYMELLKLSHKIILIDSSIEAYRVAKRENIIYHIGEFDEAPSILYMQL